MLIARMVGHKINNDPDVPRVRRCQQSIEIRQGAKERIHVAIVRNIVSGIMLWGGVEREHTTLANAKLVEGIQSRCDSVEITDSVSRRIRKRTRVYLVNYGCSPPFRRVHSGHPIHSRRQPRNLGAILRSMGRPIPNRRQSRTENRMSAGQCARRAEYHGWDDILERSPTATRAPIAQW